MKFILIILMCSSSVSREDCTIDTALDSIQKPIDNELGCLSIDTQVQFATSAFENLHDDSYIKTQCERIKEK